MKEKIVGIVNDIKLLSRIELTELKETLVQVLGVSMPVAIQQNITIEEVIEEKQTEFDFILKSFGSTKINSIKVVKRVLGLSLMEAKSLVETCPVVIKEAISLAEAENLKVEFTNAGAEIEIK
jgi:large subunit ribosomal protein L7/L12